MAKNLILYYSRKGQNSVDGSVRSIQKGNTEIVAEYIRDAVGGDLFEIETVKDYAADYYDCTDEARKEFRENARPELKRYLDSIAQYDNIFVCGPSWWDTFPMAVFSQLERLDFTGKKVMAVMTHEDGGLGNGERDLQKICKGATFGRSLSVRGADVVKQARNIAAWAVKEVS